MKDIINLTQEEIYSMFDSGIFNKIAESYLVLALKELKLEANQIQAAQINFRELLNEVGSKSALSSL